MLQQAGRVGILTKRRLAGWEGEGVFHFERSIEVETEKDTESVSVRGKVGDRRWVSVLLKGGLGRWGEIVRRVLEDLEQDLGLDLFSVVIFLHS